MAPSDDLDRRTLLQRTGAGLSWLALRGVAPATLLACDDGDDGASADPDGDTPALPELVLTKDPWVGLTGTTGARLRFETREDRALPVTVMGPDGTVSHEPTRTSADVRYEREDWDREDILPDETGVHVLHEVVLDGLVPGETYGWSIDVGGGTPREGSFRMPPPAGEAIRIGWLADTMWPNTDPSVALLAEADCDLIVHGGDLQYESNPLDTWRGAFEALAPLLAQTPFQLVVGNHEYEAGYEIEDMYDRLFGHQGEDGGTRWFALTVGAVRILCLDSETVSLSDTSTEQYAWLQDQLEAVDADGDLLFAIVAFHRPVYSFSKHYTSSTLVQDALMPLFTAHGVPLVLAGHAHDFEHFVVDGVHFVVDGTGGAITYNPDAMLDLVEQQRPDLLDARLFRSRAFGCSVIDIAPDGAIHVDRFESEQGTVEYTIDIPAPGSGGA